MLLVVDRKPSDLQRQLSASLQVREWARSGYGFEDVAAKLKAQGVTLTVFDRKWLRRFVLDGRWK